MVRLAGKRRIERALTQKVETRNSQLFTILLSIYDYLVIKVTCPKGNLHRTFSGPLARDQKLDLASLSGYTLPRHKWSPSYIWCPRLVRRVMSS